MNSDAVGLAPAVGERETEIDQLVIRQCQRLVVQKRPDQTDDGLSLLASACAGPDIERDAMLVGCLRGGAGIAHRRDAEHDVGKDDGLRRDVVKARAEKLRRLGAAALTHYLERQIGREVQVLLENDGEGRTPQFAEITLDEPGAAGDIVRARVTASDGVRLAGVKLQRTADARPVSQGATNDEVLTA